MTNNFKVIEVVESEAISKNTVFDKDIVITFYNDTSKIKIGDGKTSFNSLKYIGGDYIPASVQTALNAKVTANTAITAGTKAKITYDAKGLVTAGADLVAADIPVLDTAKITTGTFVDARIPALAISKITGLQTALDDKLTATTAQFNAKLTADKVASQAASTAGDLDALIVDFNALLTKLKEANIML